jgi:hypothetical protein
VHTLLLTAALLAAAPAEEAKEIEVLFIGNSLTEYNELPWMVLAMARSEGIPMRYEQVTSGGMSLEQHWAAGKGEAVAKIASRKWTWVVLQEHSTRPLDEPAKHSEFVKLFDAKIKANGARTLLYLTWPKKDAPDAQAKLTKVYGALAKEVGATLVSVGPAWERSMKERPAVELFDEDGLHPSPFGSFLSALVFHRAIHGKPVKSPPKQIALMGTVLVDFEATDAGPALGLIPYFQKIAAQ